MMSFDDSKRGTKRSWSEDHLEFRRIMEPWKGFQYPITFGVPRYKNPKDLKSNEERKRQEVEIQYRRILAFFATRHLPYEQGEAQYEVVPTEVEKMLLKKMNFI